MIYINSQHASWADPSAAAAQQYRVGWFSTPSPDRVIQHELAHREHAQKIGRRMITAMIDLPPDHANEIIHEVSRYAATSQAEFVAETRVGIRAGYKYSNMVMEYYTSLGGPP